MGKDISQFSMDDLKAYIKELESQIKQDKKYGLVWDKENTPEQVVLDCKDKIPTLIEDESKKIHFDGVNNILIEGDNFHSLSSLRLIGENSIDIIYIDPPYNTGHQDFIYNDKFVDKEDGYKHSKWLSFMEKRLFLCKTLLKEKSLIFISIDEHEYANLKLLCDKVFGEQNYIENFIWLKNSVKNLSKTTSTIHEYILCYAKNIFSLGDKNFRIPKPGLESVLSILEEAKRRKLSIKESEKLLKDFYKSNSDLKGISMYDKVDISNGTYRAFRLSDISAPKSSGKASTYDVIHPITQKPCKVPSRGWAYTKNTMLDHIKNGLIYFYDDETKVPAYKRFLDTVTDEVIKSSIINYDEGKKELRKIFQTEDLFENSKPVSLMKTIISLLNNDSALVLDFFAGSGTTGQAVLELNKEDGGNRRFILCTNNENGICENVTYPRLKTVITGIRTDGTKYSDGIPANLRYFKTDFVKDQANRDSAKYALVEKCNGLLCILEDCFDLKENKTVWFKYESSDKCMYIFNDYYDKSKFDEMKESIKSCGKKVVLYVYSTDETVDTLLIEDLKNVEMKPIPTKIYEIYKEIVESIKRG